MIYSMVPFPVTLSDPWLRFQGHGVIFGLWMPSTYCVRSIRAICLR